MSKAKLVLMALILLGITACGGSKPERYITKKSASYHLRIEKSACFGTCPVYNLDLYSEGKALFEGIRFVDYMGQMQERQLAPVEFDSLEMYLLQAEYFDLDSAYTSNVTDLPATTLKLEWGGVDERKDKEVYLYYGYPEKVESLLAYLERLRLRYFSAD